MKWKIIGGSTQYVHFTSEPHPAKTFTSMQLNMGGYYQIFNVDDFCFPERSIERNESVPNDIAAKVWFNLLLVNYEKDNFHVIQELNGSILKNGLLGTVSL